jgi:tryptophan halogenase
MNQRPIKSIVIVGGGIAGWMTATALASVCGKESCSIRLIESEDAGTARLDEATIPTIQEFNRRFGIDEPELMRATNATFRLGTRFEDWGAIGDSYLHTSGKFGQKIDGIGFQHYWLKQRLTDEAMPIGEFALSCVAANKGRFQHPVDDQRSVYSTYSYAFHLDAALFVNFLRDTAEKLGVQQIDDKVVDVHLGGKDGFINSVQLKSGECVDGELFVDCTGFRGLLIGDTLRTGYEDWRGWLPFDSALLVQTESAGEPLPYTCAKANHAGWQWRVPLQNRVDNGHIYSSAYISDDAATNVLLNSLEGKSLSDPELVRVKPGKRLKTWRRNCVAIGSSSGFVGPLEATGIFLIHAAITKLIEYFPDAEFPAANTSAYNRDIDTLYAGMRDFVILHYKATQRDDSKFWDYCREMSVPEELALRIQLFATRGVVPHGSSELFNESSWLAVFLGQGIIPEDYDPRVDRMQEEQILHLLRSMREHISRSADAMPSHRDAIREYCDLGAST